MKNYSFPVSQKLIWGQFYLILFRFLFNKLDRFLEVDFTADIYKMV